MARHGAAEPGRWRVFADTGGTFTDLLGVAPDGSRHRAKVLSSSRLRGTVLGRAGGGALAVAGGWPHRRGLVRGATLRPLAAAGERALRVLEDGDDGHALTTDGDAAALLAPGSAFELAFDEPPSVLGARLLTGTAAGTPLPPMELRLATTIATNALLTRSVAATALFVTRGLADLLVIGDQARPDLFALDIRPASPLHAAVVEVDARVAADGTPIAPVRRAAILAAAGDLRARGVEAAAVALIHADRYPEQEREVGALLREAGFDRVTLSSEMARAIRLVPRAATAVADAALAPVVDAHIERVRGALPGSRFHVMTSAGGLIDAASARATSMLLSGPAGGVVGAAAAARRAGVTRLIGFDMGGTSTDVARYDGDFEYDFEHRVADVTVVAPALALHTVAAGGGSTCAVDAGGLGVGPESAGAAPGPACYGAGGPLTLTDVNLLLGRLDPGRFGIPVDVAAAERAAHEEAERLEALHGERAPLSRLLEGFREIADERMAGAIREITTRRGVDPGAHVLVAFGGAGGQHACAVAERLGIDTVLVPGEAGLLSACGLESAVLERFAERQVLAPLDAAAPRLEAWLDALGKEASSAVVREGASARTVRVRRRIAALRFAGQDATIEIEIEDVRGMAARFRDRYVEIFGYVPRTRAIELVTLRVIAAVGERQEPRDATPDRSGTPSPDARLEPPVGGAGDAVPVHERATLPAGSTVRGPALVVDPFSTTWVAGGWRAEVSGSGTLRLLRSAPAGDAGADPARRAGAAREQPEEVRLELFTRRVTAIAREMGRALERTAVSTNVRERRDFSCALLDAAGRLVVHAPHVPVHLGSLGLCVREVVAALPLGRGDVAVTNHPGYGGSHLPDVTVLAPVHAGERRVGFVAARAHHAEIGGQRPGSMPPEARRLADEGVVLPPALLFEAGAPRWDALRARLSSGPWPTRALDDNLADVRAAVAACRRGADALARLVGAEGAAEVAGRMDALRRRAARRVREALAARGRESLEARDTLDDGTPIAVRIAIADGRATFDFAGTGGVHPGNLNATPAIVRSVVLYVLRLLVAEDMPLNEGLLDPVSLRIPEGLLAPAFPADAREAPAVTGGNVETSQRLANLLVTTLGLAAASQGTMNNLLFGNERRSHYETIAGGAGAGPGFEGASAVHTHMTNTRITDPEILETRHPARLLRFAVRRGSGGAGAWRGGDGVVREIEFTERLSLSLLTQHRERGPAGLDGGGEGCAGRQRLVRADGREEVLAAVDGAEVFPGDRLVLETPGGGGCGAVPGGRGAPGRGSRGGR